MSDKIIRDELLRSHRYQSLSTDTAKLLFMHLLLASDHYSNAEANSTAVSIIMRREMSDEACAVLLSEMADKDLVRPYQVDGKSYVHIPRSRQRIRFLSSKHPRPPTHVEDLQIKALIEKVSRAPGRREEKRSTALPQTQGTPVDNSVEKWWATTQTMTRKATALGLQAHPGETRDAFYQRIRQAITNPKTPATVTK